MATRTGNNLQPVTDDAIRAATRYTTYVMVAGRMDRGTFRHVKPIKRSGRWGKRAGYKGRNFRPFIGWEFVGPESADIRVFYVDGVL